MPNVQWNLENDESRYPFSSQMQLRVESDDLQTVSWAVNKSSEVWWIKSIWLSKNISRFRSDSRILLKVVCTLAFACVTCIPHITTLYYFNIKGPSAYQTVFDSLPR